jgi:TolB-like protein/tetratricopeptide (TPR) repeat protein
MNNFFRELKRRNVYKVAVAYAVVAWLLLQALSILLPAFEAPAWVLRVFIAAIAAGFPLALIFAWAFELTPEGIKRTEDVAPDESITHRTGRKLTLIVSLIAAVAVGLLLFQTFRSTDRAPAVAPPAASESRSIPEKSIAVLPFDNLSRDPDNAYFTEGVQDEILTRLAKVADLKVISRTSTQRFKSSPDNLPQIAKQLGVMHLLEGSVQKSGDAVRVNVQLINAHTDTHLWAETYDRKLVDIFAVETDIAQTIADTLQAKLTGAEKSAIAKRPTVDSRAYELYLKGRYFWNKRTGPGLRKAIDYFKEATEMDPKFATAFAGLADAYVLLPGYGAGTPQEAYPHAKAAAKKGLGMDDTLAEAHTSLGLILSVSDLDFANSIKEFERAIALNPNYATAHHWFGNSVLLAAGQFDRAIAEGKRAVELDPLSLIINADLGCNYLFARRYEEAIEQLRKTIEMDPGFYYARWNLGLALELKGQLHEALAEYKRAAELDDDPFVLALVAQASAKLGQREEAVRLLEQLQQLATGRYVSGGTFALVHIALGDKDRAIEWLERSYHDGAHDLSFLEVDPMLDPLRDHPRFQALVEKVFGRKR